MWQQPLYISIEFGCLTVFKEESQGAVRCFFDGSEEKAIFTSLKFRAESGSLQIRLEYKNSGLGMSNTSFPVVLRL